MLDQSQSIERGFGVFSPAVQDKSQSRVSDPDPGSQKCPYGSGSRPLIFYPDPDPKGVKIKEDNLFKQIFN